MILTFIWSVSAGILISSLVGLDDPINWLGVSTSITLFVTITLIRRWYAKRQYSDNKSCR